MLIKNEILKVDNESRIADIFIQLNSHYKKFIDESPQGFLDSIEAKGKRIYLKFIEEDLENFKVEPMIFKSQIEEVKKYLIN
jgi:ribonuclease G